LVRLVAGLVLIWSRIWYGKLIFLKIIKKKKIICLKIVIWSLDSVTPLARLPTGRHSIGRVSGAGVVASHVYS